VLFPYPHPKILGLIMDPKRSATVRLVAADSPAEKSGFQAGDEILSLAGQPLVSLADIQWVLHNAADVDKLDAPVRRDGRTIPLELELSPGWRSEGDISWRATSWALRRMTTGGLRLEELPAERRADRRLDRDALALLVSHVGEYGEHAHAKQQGFRREDVIVSIADQTNRMSESELFALLVNKPIGEEVPVRVLRGSEQVELRLRMQK
jgi:S1-C subfamily serine protease